MGLDASFYASATMVHGDKHPRALTDEGDGPGEECWDTFEVVYVNPHFPDQADSVLHHACYETDGERVHISHSYSGYNQFRRWLCKGALDVDCEQVWEAPEAFHGKPFVELIHFADNEGTIGPQCAQRLAVQFREQREFVVGSWYAMPKGFDVDQDSHERSIGMMVKRYDEWAAAFATVGDTGFVVFS